MSKQKETVTFRLDAAKKAALDEIAADMDRDRSYVLNQAVDAYIDVNRWQIEEIRKGLAEAEAGDFATDEEVEAAFARWSNAGQVAAKRGSQSRSRR